MKKLSIIFTLILLAGVLTVPASAAEPKMMYETTVCYLDDCGEVEIETVTIVHDSVTRSSTKSVEKTQTVKVNGTVVATITLKATFGYDGSSAWMVSASTTKSTSGGWSYGGQSIVKNGGTVTLTAKLTKDKNDDIPISISMTCSPTGAIS